MTADSSTCNSDQSVPAITIVTINSARADRAVTTICHFCLHAGIPVRYIRSFFS